MPEREDLKCPGCGVNLEFRCPQCNKPIAPRVSALYCSHCAKAEADEMDAHNLRVYRKYHDITGAETPSQEDAERKE